jgi:hypothetical protein
MNTLKTDSGQELFFKFQSRPTIAVNSVKLTKLPSMPVKEVRVAIQQYQDLGLKSFCHLRRHLHGLNGLGGM